MQLISKTTVIDDATYEPVHTLTFEVWQTRLDDLAFIKERYGINEAATIIGVGLLEQILKGK
jgi:hypothetical protein